MSVDWLTERFHSFAYDEIVEDLTAALAEFEAVAAALEAAAADALTDGDVM